MRNIVFVGTENGARIKTWQGGSGLVENISYVNLVMEGVGLPIKIDMYYCPDGGCHNHTQGVCVCVCVEPKLVCIFHEFNIYSVMCAINM